MNTKLFSMEKVSVADMTIRWGAIHGLTFAEAADEVRFPVGIQYDEYGPFVWIPTDNCKESLK